MILDHFRDSVIPSSPWQVPKRLVGGSSRFPPAVVVTILTSHAECAWAKQGRSFSMRHWAHWKELGRGPYPQGGFLKWGFKGKPH